jgi:hypothetical protein
VAGGGGLARAVEVDAARRRNSGLAAADSTRERRQEMEAEWGLGEGDRCDPLLLHSEEPKEYGRCTSAPLIDGPKDTRPSYSLSRAVVASNRVRKSRRNRIFSVDLRIQVETDAE